MEEYSTNNQSGRLYNRTEIKQKGLGEWDTALPNIENELK